MIPARSIPASAALLAIFLLGAAGARAAGDDDDEGTAGLELGSATPGDIGLAVYPGARARKKSDSGPLKMGLWGGSEGFRLALAQYRSADDARKVAAFYSKDLARFGAVVDCSASADAAQRKSAGCEKSDPDEGTFELRVGPKSDRHIVAITPRKSGGCKFVLLRLRVKGDEG